MTVERYERFLSFAIALGIEKPWTEHFAATMPKEPAEYRLNWARGKYGGGCSLACLNSALVSLTASGVSSSLPQSSSFWSPGRIAAHFALALAPFSDSLQVFHVLRAGASGLVFYDMRHPDERQTVDHFRRVDQFIDVEGADPPFGSESHIAIPQFDDFDVIIREVFNFADFSNCVPRAAAAQHVEIV